jgi:hypothetical protein
VGAGGRGWPTVARRPVVAAWPPLDALLGVANQQPPLFFFFSNLFYIYTYNFLSFIYLYFFINIDTFRDLIGAEVPPNGICQKISRNLTPGSDL